LNEKREECMKVVLQPWERENEVRARAETDELEVSSIAATLYGERALLEEDISPGA
jgi:hypothetical protein